MVQLCLAAMPWQALEWPSIAVGVLSRSARAHGHAVVELHGALELVDHLLTATEGRLGVADYATVAHEGYLAAVGEWIFTPALHRRGDHRVEEYARFLAAKGIAAEAPIAMHRESAAFVDRLAHQVVASGARVLALTASFAQTVASLALARAVKALDADIVTVLGGSSCDGVMGLALHRNFREVDVVVRGEAERAWPALLAALDAGDPVAGIPGITFRDANGRQVIGEPAALVAPADLVAPDYDGWFARLHESQVAEEVQPKVALESARGCWWGERRHCTFCGLNGSAMRFRSKHPDAVFEEIMQATARHQVGDVMMVDNILDLGYLDTLIPRLAAADVDLRIFYETKSCLAQEQVRSLAAAGVTTIQPGIESLSSRVLGLMRKGSTGAAQVRLLRDCAAHGVAVAWNWLYGFPGETPADYAPLVAAMGDLVHLPAPDGIGRIALERFAPYFDQPDLGFAERAAGAEYAFLFDLPPGELDDIAFHFDTPDRGLSDEQAAPLRAALERWQEASAGSALTWREVGGHLHIADRRAGRPARDHVITDPAERSAYQLLARDLTPRALAAKLARGDLAVADLDALLAAWAADGLVFTDGGRCVALALPDVPGASAGAESQGFPTEVLHSWEQATPRRRGDGPRRHLRAAEPPDATWPDGDAVRTAVDGGLAAVTLEAPVDLAGAGAVWALAFLRDAAAVGLAVDWAAAAIPAQTGHLLHLAPPRNAPDDWRDGHRTARLGWRAGPGFLVVEDTRSPDEPVRWLLDDLRYSGLLRALQRPLPLTDLPADAPAAELADGGLVAGASGWLVSLAARTAREPARA